MTQPHIVTPSFQPPLSPGKAQAGTFQSSENQPPARMTQETAFDLLREVVREFELSGKQPLAAGIKPQMQARSGNAFSESELGYVTFREFLEAAVRAGGVEMRSEGPHLRMHVPGISPAPLRSRRTHKYRESGLVHIPPHLWTAFVDWAPGKRRFYDRDTKTAIVFSASPAADETAGHLTLRARVAADSDRFVEIQPLTFETQVGWMKDYADALSDPNDRRLATLILENDPKPANAFNVFLRRNQHLLAAWKAFRVDRVREAIRTWMNDHDIDASVLDATKPEAQTDARESTVRHDLEHVRLRVHAAVEKMPIAELLRLSIPVEYMIESE